jgi:hypothetical protein
MTFFPEGTTLEKTVNSLCIIKPLICGKLLSYLLTPIFPCLRHTGTATLIPYGVSIYVSGLLFI